MSATKKKLRVALVAAQVRVRELSELSAPALAQKVSDLETLLAQAKEARCSDLAYANQAIASEKAACAEYERRLAVYESRLNEAEQKAAKLDAIIRIIQPEATDEVRPEAHPA